MGKYSDCCGAPVYSNGDCDTEDFGICPDCKEHCEYEESCDECGEEISECTCNEKAEPLTPLKNIT